MSKKSNVLTIRMPRDLKDRIEKAAGQQGVSMNQFAIYAFTRGISELEVASFFQEQYAGKTRQQIFREFDAVMNEVPTRKKRPQWDEIDP